MTATTMDAREIKIRRRLRDDFTLYAPRCLRIRAKDGRILPLVLNAAQQHLHERLEAQLARRGRIRALVLKGRQQGISTYVEGRYYWRVTHRRGTRAYILTHEQEATSNIFAIVQRYHAHCPPVLKPRTEASNAKELLFAGLESGYKVGTAGAKGTGRSSTIQLFHGSEVAFWPHAETHQAGVMQAIPDVHGTEEILESTANGVGGVFYDLWQDASSGRSEYMPVFIPWFWQPEYRMEDTRFEPDSAELALGKLHALDNAQLAWRRARIAKLGSIELFRQEYPCTADEAFVYSGRAAFEPLWLDRAQAECCAPLYRADVRADRFGELLKRAEGALRVWQDPKPGERYVIGADVAEGLEHGDYSCADVLRESDGAQVAHWHGHCDPDRFAAILASLGKRYAKALIGVERNNHGLTTLTSLRNGGYAHLYAQQDIERRSEGFETKKVGWLTTTRSKVKIIDQLAAELRDGDHGILCGETVAELRTYVVTPEGAYTAKPGCHDDRVMARAIAGEMWLTARGGRVERKAA